MRFKALRRTMEWGRLGIIAVLGFGTAFAGQSLFASSSVVGIANGSGTIRSGEYAGQAFTVHLSGEYSGFGSGTLTSGAGTIVQIGAERFEGDVDPLGWSLCCGEGSAFPDWFSMTGHVRHVTAAVPHDHLFGASGDRASGAICINIMDQTGATGPLLDPPHDPGIGLICDIPAVVTISENVARVVVVDIKPGSFPNVINLASHGVIPVAVLSTGDFDATTIDPMSVRFGPDEAAEVHGKGHLADVNGDGRLDLVLHFATEATGIVAGSTSASLTGRTIDGVSFEGSDAIVTVPR